MTLAAIGNNFQVNSVPVSIDIPTRLNIKKRRERVVYRTLSGQDNINAEYLIGKESTPAGNLFISDRSVSLTQNRIPATPDIIIETTNQLVLNVDKFLVTDVFTPETPTRPATPLFFVHTLNSFHPGLPGFENKTLLTLDFTDHTFRAIQTPDFVLNSALGQVFSNIENVYDSLTGDFTATYVKYTVRTVDGPNQTIEVFHEVMSSTPAFTEASFDDLDPEGCVAGISIIQDGRKKYLLSQRPGGQTFQVILPGRKSYGYQETPGSRIKVVAPTAIGIGDPWNVRVTNGKFLTSLPVSETDSLTFQYRVAEFNAQNFSPAPPFKLQTEHKAVWLYPNLVKTPKNIVEDDQLKLYVDVIVRDRAGEVKFVYTNDPLKLGVLFSEGNIKYTEGILSIDKSGGFIELLGPLRSDDETVCSYYTIEDQYEFTAIDFNPVNNLNILTQRVVIYVMPESAFTAKLDSSLQYLIVNSLGEILYSSQVADNPGSLHVSTIRMLEEDFDAEGLPTHKFYYDRPSTTIGLESEPSDSDAIREQFSFIDKYTVESKLSPDLDPDELVNFVANSRFLVLADLYVGENQSPESLTKFDVRIGGGGIKKDKRQDALHQQPEASWFWDFNVNRPYPSAGAFFAEIPESVQIEFGGRFTRKEIVDVVNRHMKLGGYAIVKTYGINPVITPCPIATDTTITAKWPSYGAGITYNVYVSKAINGSFVAANGAAIADTGDLETSNSYAITGLDSLTQYFIYIGATKDSETESNGPIVAMATTATIGI